MVVGATGFALYAVYDGKSQNNLQYVKSGIEESFKTSCMIRVQSAGFVQRGKG